MTNKSKNSATTKILIVDDKQSRAIMLNSYGYDVESIGDALEAYLFIQEEHPDLVLLELNKENPGRFQLWERIKLLNPRPIVAFLIKDAIYRPLSCVQEFIGQRRKGRHGVKVGRSDLIDQVAALFAA
jgi:CheY-like chemotaxis protein